MVTGASLHTSVLALWLLVDRVLCQTTTATPSTTNSALASTSTFVSPSLNRNDGPLSEDGKIGVSIGVTFAVIILVGSVAIFCVIRRRERTLTKPQRATGSRDNLDDENAVVGGNLGKGKDVYYMNATPNGHHGVLSPAADGAAYQGGYPTAPDQVYAPQGQPQVMSYPTAQYGETYAYPGTSYPSTAALDASQQNTYAYAGPSNTQYRPEKQGPSKISNTNIFKIISSRDKAGAQATSPDPASTQGDGYHVPPPHPHASELPDQRKPVELMGEGHYKEAP
ncbi:hypothetical protein EKO27_g7151 [Xylaria grammica]|uniref:Mid2 domain-containing protein n=1 Tax=Xylaria grammica TaxID=363999 RepID=A0A439D0H8_9PEZI|nr:hypothetical protein EKO27_g7151 [Xylaria grammica]